MIFTERTITVVNDSATINKPLILYRGDKNIELKITIAESQFKFRNTDASNVIETTDASYAQLVINTPYNSPIFSDVAVTKNGAVIFVITEAMIDEIREVGAYEIQIRLLDDNKQSRASIPPVSNAIEIREPIAIEDGSAVDSNAVNTARVNRALTTTSAPLEVFDSQGNYIKKIWGDGDTITDAALNKLEAGIDGVNKKVANNSSQIKDIENKKSDKTTTENIQQQVNNLVLGAVGDGNNAEVVQARGKYDTLNDRLNMQSTEVENFIDLKYSMDFKLGKFSSTGVTSSTTRIVTNSICYAEEDITVKTKSGYRYALAYYTDSDGNGFKDNGWKIFETVIKKGSYFRIMVSATTETTETLYGGSFDALSIYYNFSFSGVIDRLNSYDTILNSYIDKKYKYEWVIANVTSSGIASNTKRISTKNIEYAENDMIISLDNYNLYKFIIFTYSDDIGSNYKNCGEQTHDYMVPKGTYFRILLRRVTEIDITDIKSDELYKSLNIIHPNSFKTIDRPLYYQVPFYSLLLPRRIKYVAHKGYSNLAPANSLPAFEEAGKVDKIFGIETDIQITKDGIPVCYHDDDLSSLTTGTGAISENTLEQVSSCVINKGANIENYTNLKIPTFEEYLQVCTEYGKVPFIEFKAQMLEYSDYKVVIKNIIDTIKQFGLEDSCVIMSMNIEMLYITRNYSNRIHIGYVTNNNFDIETPYFLHYLKAIQNCGLLIGKDSICDNDKINILKRYGFTFGKWTFDNITDVKNNSKYLLDFAITNDFSDL